MLSSVEQMMLVALSDDGDDLAFLAKRADQLGRDISNIQRFCSMAIARLASEDPLRQDLLEVHAAAELAAQRLTKLQEQSCRPRLWLVP